MLTFFEKKRSAITTQDSTREKPSDNDVQVKPSVSRQHRLNQLLSLLNRIGVSAEFILNIL